MAPTLIIFAQPDGRRCDTCPNKDADEDPAIRKLRERRGPSFDPLKEDGPWLKSLRRTKEGKLLCWWSAAQTSTGLTQKPSCGYCCSVYACRVRPRKVTIAQWKADLGSNMQQLETHQTAVLVLVDQIADKGCCYRVRVNWQSVDLQPAAELYAGHALDFHLSRC